MHVFVGVYLHLFCDVIPPILRSRWKLFEESVVHCTRLLNWLVPKFLCKCMRGEMKRRKGTIRGSFLLCIVCLAREDAGHRCRFGDNVVSKYQEIMQIARNDDSAKELATAQPLTNPSPSPPATQFHTRRKGTGGVYAGRSLVTHGRLGRQGCWVSSKHGSMKHYGL